MAYTKKDTTKDVVKTTKKEEVKEESAVKVEAVNDTVVEKSTSKEAELEKQIADLQAMVSNLLKEKESTPAVQIVDTTSRMDKPCTLIHLLECPSDLPTSIIVNGNPYYFHAFGERKTFRLADMQTITTQYRDRFVRGIFTLGEDCNELQDEFGIEVSGVPMSVQAYKRLGDMSASEFENIVSGMNSAQQVLLAKTWVQRYRANKEGYDNVDKMRILNKVTRGMLKDILKETVDEY